jgi:hypothetical protein
MIMHRRTFIQGAAFVAATPAIAGLFALPTSVQSHPTEVPSRSTQAAETGSDENSILFKIYGWDDGGEIALDRSSTNTVLIRINQFWRIAWR